MCRHLSKEAGALRAKNAKNIMLKNLMDACCGGFVYYAFGYMLSYESPGDGTGNPVFGGFVGTSPWFPYSGCARRANPPLLARPSNG